MSLSLGQEERLCELIREYPILYDKSSKGYKERDAVSNCWEEVASLVDFLPLAGASAKNAFENFKKRYLKKRNVFKKSISCV